MGKRRHLGHVLDEWVEAVIAAEESRKGAGSLRRRGFGGMEGAAAESERLRDELAERITSALGPVSAERDMDGISREHFAALVEQQTTRALARAGRRRAVQQLILDMRDEAIRAKEDAGG